jgi:hypothetical protein
MLRGARLLLVMLRGGGGQLVEGWGATRVFERIISRKRKIFEG